MGKSKKMLKILEVCVILGKMIATEDGRDQLQAGLCPKEKSPF